MVLNHIAEERLIGGGGPVLLPPSQYYNHILFVTINIECKVERGKDWYVEDGQCPHTAEEFFFLTYLLEVQTQVEMCLM